MMEKKIQTRFYDVNLETREAEETGTITGRPIVYNQVTDLGYFDEMIMDGALDNTDLTDVRLCLNHDTSYVYARSRRNNPRSTMRLNPNAFGLDIEADLNIKSSPKAQDFFSAIQRGDIDKMSFMFLIDEEEWENMDTDHPLRKIRSISKVYEVSAVTFPAYEQTEINARSKEELESYRSSLESGGKARSLDSGKAGDDIETKKREEREALELAKLKAKITGGI